MSKDKKHDIYEVYVTGYSKAKVEKDDLYQYFKSVGTIKDISYKGPFSFVGFDSQ